MAQPPLSQQLKSMEAEIGSDLFFRHGRKLELTEAGLTLYERAKTLLNSFEDSILEVKETGEGLRGTLNLGCVMSSIEYLPEQINKFNASYPNVKIKVWAGDPYRLTENLEENDIELAIVRSPLDTRNYEVLELSKDPFVFIFPKKWEQLSNRSSITMEEICQFPLIALHRVNGVGVYELVLKEFHRHGLEPNYIFESPDATILLAMVQAGLGGVLLPESVLFTFPKEKIKTLTITDSLIHTTTSLIWKKDRYKSKAASRFIELFLPSHSD